MKTKNTICNLVPRVLSLPTSKRETTLGTRLHNLTFTDLLNGKVFILS